jgi:hypothetical protein
MLPFFKKKQAEKQTEKSAPFLEKPIRKEMIFSQLISDMGDYSDLGTHDIALKFWLPEAAERAVQELANIDGVSMSEAYRQFFVIHCYGLYLFNVMKNQRPSLFKEDEFGGIRFSRTHIGDPPGKKRVDTYWVPALGKNVAPVKVWVPKRVQDDLQTLADHVGIKLSQYVREIVISRLLGHGTLPKRPEMLEAAPLAATEDWCDGKDIPWREVDYQRFCNADIRRMETEWVDDGEAELGS